MLGLYREHYADHTVKHFHEQLVKRHGYKPGYTVTKVHLQRAGLVVPAARRSAHRKKRPRRPLERSEEHRSELHSLMRISYAVFCLKNKKKNPNTQYTNANQQN